MDLDGLGVDLEPLVLVNEKILHSIALVALQLDHVAGLFIVDDGAVAGELFLDDLEDLLEVKLGWDAFDRGQRLATITLLDADVDVWPKKLDKADGDDKDRWPRTGLRGLLSSLSSVLILRIRKGICLRLENVAFIHFGSVMRGSREGANRASTGNKALKHAPPNRAMRSRSGSLLLTR